MSLYDTDFYAWANAQAALLKSGRLAAADVEHIAEEIESMGRSEKRELLSRLALLLMHLLKWQVQPTLRGNSRQATIKVQRREIARHLADNPSLMAGLPEVLADAYGDAMRCCLRRGKAGWRNRLSLRPTPWLSARSWTMASCLGRRMKACRAERRRRFRNFRTWPDGGSTTRAGYWATDVAGNGPGYRVRRPLPSYARRRNLVSHILGPL